MGGDLPPVDVRGLFPDLVLEHLQEADRAISQPEICLEPTALLGACQGTDAFGGVSTGWDSRQPLL